MAHLIPNTFSSWELTPEEELQGSTLTTLQKQVIQNQIALLAQEKNMLVYDPSNPFEFVQQEADLKGQISSLQYLFILSDDAVEQLNNPEPPLNQE